MLRSGRGKSPIKQKDGADSHRNLAWDAMVTCPA